MITRDLQEKAQSGKKQYKQSAGHERVFVMSTPGPAFLAGYLLHDKQSCVIITDLGCEHVCWAGRAR